MFLDEFLFKDRLAFLIVWWQRVRFENSQEVFERAPRGGGPVG